jgi:hypothetical protein
MHYCILFAFKRLDKLEFERHYAKTFLKKSFCTSKNFKKRKTKLGVIKLHMITVGADALHRPAHLHANRNDVYCESLCLQRADEGHRPLRNINFV